MAQRQGVMSAIKIMHPVVDSSLSGAKTKRILHERV